MSHLHKKYRFLSSKNDAQTQDRLWYTEQTLLAYFKIYHNKAHSNHYKKLRPAVLTF